LLVLDELWYSEEHVWVRPEENNTVTLGVTDYAQLELGHLDYIELPNEGDSIVSREPFGSVECAKVVTDLYSPVSGKVVAVNEDVIDNPTFINFWPYTKGWIIRARLSSLDELKDLMPAEDYEEYILTRSF